MEFLNRKTKLVRLSKIITPALALLFLLIPKIASAGIWDYVGTGLGWISGGVTNISTGVFSVLMWLLQQLLAAVLSIVAFLLNNLFYYNAILNPISMPVVQEGWALTRDIVNSLYILVILWIAITFVFNLENLGGKRLLLRIIISALLVNFSLAFLGAIFGISNAIASPFKDAIEAEGDITGIIVNRVQISRVFATSLNDGTEKLKNQVTSAGESNCGLSALSSGNFDDKGCLGRDGAAEFASGVLGGAAETNIWWSNALQLAIGNIFLLLLIIGFGGATLMLLARIIAMVFLGVIAPLAFLSIGLPGAGGKLWSTWIQKSLSWAFVLPVFYFLLYMSIKILIVMTSSPAMQPVANTNFSGNMLQMLPFVVFLGFLFATLKSGKYIGAMGADALMGIGKKVGMTALGAAGGVALGAATGGVGLVARAGAGKLTAPGGVVTRAAETLARAPVLGTIVGEPAQRAVARQQEARRQRVESRAKELGSLSQSQQMSGYRAAIDPEIRAAYLKAMADKNNLGMLEKEVGETGMRQAAELSARYGMQQSILEVSPHIITNNNFSMLVPGAKSRADAIQKMVSRQPDKAKLAQAAKSDPEVLNGIMVAIRGQKELKKILDEDPLLYKKLVQQRENPDNPDRSINNVFDELEGLGSITKEYADVRKTLFGKMLTSNYLNTNLGRVMGGGEEEEETTTTQPSQPGTGSVGS